MEPVLNDLLKLTFYHISSPSGISVYPFSCIFLRSLLNLFSRSFTISPFVCLVTPIHIPLCLLQQTLSTTSQPTSSLLILIDSFLLVSTCATCNQFLLHTSPVESPSHELYQGGSLFITKTEAYMLQKSIIFIFPLYPHSNLSALPPKFPLFFPV